MNKEENFKDNSNHANADCEKISINQTNDNTTNKLLSNTVEISEDNKCNYCNNEHKTNIENFSNKNNKNFHEYKCPKYLIECELNCGESIERLNYENHLNNNCINKIIPCTYVKFGCNIKLNKNKLDEHLNKELKFHHNLLLNNYYITNKIDDNIKTSIEDLEIKYNVLFKEVEIIKENLKYYENQINENIISISDEYNNKLNTKYNNVLCEIKKTYKSLKDNKSKINCLYDIINKD